MTTTALTERFRFRPLYVKVFVALLALLLPIVVQNAYFRGILVLAGIFALLALSMDLLLGYAGQISFGHAGFFGLGAYTVGLLMTRTDLSYWIAMVLAILLAWGVGLLLAVLSLRLVGVFFAIATLAFAEILRLVNLNWVEFTRGSHGLSVPRPNLPFTDVTMDNRLHYYYMALGLLFLMLFVLERITAGPLGRRFKAIRESESLAASLGINVFRTKVIAFGMSGAIAALAGAVYAPFFGVLTPGVMGVHYTATALLMVVIGGKGVLYGAIIGALIFAIVPEVLRTAQNLRMVFFGLALILAVTLMPGGIWRLPASIRRRRRRSDTEGDPAAEPDDAGPSVSLGATQKEGG